MIQFSFSAQPGDPLQKCLRTKRTDTAIARKRSASSPTFSHLHVCYSLPSSAHKLVTMKNLKNPRSVTAKKPPRAASRNGRPRLARAAGTDPKRVRAILAKLDEAYPSATCALVHENPFQLLIATILSAQCTDVRVNQVTRTLFQKYRKPEDFAYANPRDLEAEIRTCGFFRSKTKSIQGASKKIVEEFSGQVPRTMEQLLTLPGVARKTANVVLGTAFGIPSGIVVDTHVQRLSRRLDLTRNTDPKKIEQDLMPIIPKDKWIIFAHQLIWHGRRICQARKPRCMECNLEKICYSEDKVI
jgi:endonuclease III